MSAPRIPGLEARELHGFLASHKWLIARRVSQALFLALFLTGPLFGIWIAKGTLASSMTLKVLPLSDPFMLAQSLVARHWPEGLGLLGGAIVLMGYLIFGGRAYCSWVCPINPITDLARSLRRRLGLERGAKLRQQTRIYLLGAILLVSAATGTLAWELVNPITALHRALVFGAWFGVSGAAAIFFFDLLVAKDGWCGHICPVGAAYGLIGKASLLRVSAAGRERCDDCMDCYAACPEQQVISPALKGAKTGAGPVILSGDCTNCGGCIDVCPERVFRFALRTDQRLDARPSLKPAASDVTETAA